MTESLKKKEQQIKIYHAPIDCPQCGKQIGSKQEISKHKYEVHAY